MGVHRKRPDPAALPSKPVGEEPRCPGYPGRDPAPSGPACRLLPETLPGPPPDSLSGHSCSVLRIVPGCLPCRASLIAGYQYQRIIRAPVVVSQDIVGDLLGALARVQPIGEIVVDAISCQDDEIAWPDRERARHQRGSNIMADHASPGQKRVHKQCVCLPAAYQPAFDVSDAQPA